MDHSQMDACIGLQAKNMTPSQLVLGRGIINQ